MTAVAPTLTPMLWPTPRTRAARPLPARPVRVTRPGRPRRAVYLRRRVAVALAATVGLLGVANAAGALSGGAAGAHHVASLRVVHYTVQPGDTLWSIARALEPHRDPREVVDALVAAHPYEEVAYDLYPLVEPE